MSYFKVLAVTACVSVAAVSAQAATVLEGVTKAANDASSGPFTIYGGGDKALVSDPANAWTTTSINGSEWIWDASKVVLNGTFLGPVTFAVNFSLAGYDLATATLSGLLAVDDIVTVTLNGNTIFQDLNAYDGSLANWQGYQSYGTDVASYFNAGLNTLLFEVTNSGAYPAGLNATVLVEASPVPLPAALPLLGGAVMGMGLIGRLRKRKTLQA